MIAKILKYELFFLFILTVISILSFYYQDLFPDNFFMISAKSDSINYFYYYLTSFVALVGYYTGPWVIFPFIIYALFFSFLFSKREFLFDVFNVPFLLVSFLLITFFFFPLFLGSGVDIILRAFFPPLILGLIAVIAMVAFLGGAFRGAFKDFLMNSMKFFKKSPSNFFKPLAKYRPSNVYSSVMNSCRKSFAVVRVKIPLLLKGDSSVVESKDVEEQTFTDLQNEVDSQFDKNTGFDDFNFSTSEAPEEEQEDQGDGGDEGEEEVEYYYEDEEEFEEEPEEESEEPEELEEIEEPEEVVDYFGLVSEMTDNACCHDRIQLGDDYFDRIIKLLETKLSEFKIVGQIIEVLKGPVVDTFLLELGKGVKVSKVTSSAEDLSGALYGAPIRIVYPMKGRTSVGIEVPRNPREIIYLDEVLTSREFIQTNLGLPITMGKDAFGQVFIIDLTSMPHMLVAGATGSGKSVFINTLLVSLLVKKSPKQMKLILIDPKQLELALYAHLPHLAVPVVTDAKQASLSLRWAVQEMERRYSILKEFGVRNLDGFNEKTKSASNEMFMSINKYYENAKNQEDYVLPYVVIIVDEFADLILTKAGKEIENNVCRLAGKARAAGIHLVLATQRPSVDVITGLIKSNFPTRVSFRVTTSIDSRTILSSVGAEKLLGKGDMLYKRGVETSRVHSAYVDEDEIGRFVEKLSNIRVQYDRGALEFLENGGEVENDPYSFGSHINNSHIDSASDDVLLSDAINVVVEHRAASASMLQRKLNVGYNRAAKLIETMEEQGIVGPAQGSRPRKVLVIP